MPAQPPQYSDQYSYDVHGNMLSMPHVSAMTWNALDELESAAVGSTLSHYQYGGGQRVRKFVESTSGSTTTDERIYIGPFELYRRSNSGGVQEEIESLNVSDDTGRMLLIETKIVDSGTPVASPTGRWRYQLSNHLGSASTEVDEGGAIISYEEYHPYGTTAYRAADSQTEVSAKRYRYTGKEKDEETGLYYHGARYYACWLGRWTAADPAGLGDGNNRFRYVDNNPVKLFDPDGRKGFTAELFAAAQKVGSDIQEGVQAKLDQRQADIEKYGSNSPETLQANKDFIAKKNAKVAASRITPDRPFRKDVAEFSQQVSEGVAQGSAAAGEFAFEATLALSGNEGKAASRAALVETGARVLGGTLAAGISIAGGVAEAPDRAAAGNEAFGRAFDLSSKQSLQTRAENYLEGAGEYANVARPVFEAFLVVAPAAVGLKGSRAGLAAEEAAAADAAAAKVGVNNSVPKRLARVVPEQFADAPTLGTPGADDVFVTAADDLAGLQTSAEVAERLTLVDEAGNLLPGRRAIIEFDTPAAGLASPVNRTDPGFVGRGRTAGGAREFVLPNLDVSRLQNVRVQRIP